jgi:antitoxin YefM
MSKTLSYSNFRKNLAEIMEDVNKNAETYRITRRNAASMVVMSESDFDSLKETLFLLSNPANSAHLEESVEQFNRGEFVEVDL